MAKFRSIKNSLLGGQVSPTCLGRTDLPQYPHSCEILQNMIPMLSGGAYRRPGTLAQDSLVAYGSGGTDHPPRLIPFKASQSEAYAILLGVNGGGPTGYAKAYRATGNSTGQVTISSITGSTPYKCTASGAFPNALGNGDDDVFYVQHAQSADVMWLSHASYKPQVIKRTAIDTFTIGDFDSGLSGQSIMNAYPFLNQNTTTTTIAPSATSGSGITLTASAALFNSKHVGALIAIDHGTGTVGCAKITAYTDSTHVTADVVVNFSATTAKVQWWESAWSDYRGWPRTVCIFQQRLCFGGTIHQPDTIWFSQAANYFQFSVLGQTNPGGTILVNGSISTSAADTINGSQITVASGTINFPVDDSQGDGRTTGPTGLQPFRITIAQSQLDQIQWLSPDKELLVGTLGQEWIIAAVNGSFDVGNSQAAIQSHYGSDYIPAVRIGYELMFVLASLDECRAYQYNYIDASFFGEPVQLMFDQYPMAETNTFKPGRKKFRQMDWDITRNTLWCLDTMGNLFGMTRDRKLSVTAWHTHKFGGYDTTKGVGTGAGTNTDPAWVICDGSVVSFAISPNPFSGVNDIWLVIKRTISGNVQWQVERMIGKNTVRTSAYSSIAPGGSTSTEPLQVDAAYISTDNGDGTFNYSVGNNLNGYTLSGTYYSLTWGLFSISSTAAVSAGSATLTQPLPADYGSVTPFHIITLGLPYTSIIQTARIDAGSVIGTAQTAIKRIVRAYLRLYNSLYCKLGSAPNGEDESALEIVRFDPSANVGQSPEIFTGDKRVQVPSTYDRNGYLYIIQDQPMPFTVVSVVSEGEEFD